MRRKPGQGMNREKLICLMMVLLLAATGLLVSLAHSFPQTAFSQVYSALFGSVPAETLCDEAPRTAVLAPSGYLGVATAIPADPNDMSRDTPFAPPDGKIIIKKEDDDGDVDKDQGNTGNPIDVPDHREDSKPDPRPSFLDGASPVAYMGVLGIRGERYGMLRLKDGACRNVQEGDELDDFGCKIIRVEQQAIHLLTREGVYHILRRNGS